MDPQREMYTILRPLCAMSDSGEFGPKTTEECGLAGAIIAEYVHMQVKVLLAQSGLPPTTIHSLLELSRVSLLEQAAFTIAVARGYRAVVNALEQPEEPEITEEDLGPDLLRQFRAQPRQSEQFLQS